MNERRVNCVAGVDRRWYNDCQGLVALRKLNMFQESVARLDVELRNKFYALASVNALIR